MDAYQSDLADIHESGFTHFALGAASVLRKELSPANGNCKTVVDLGCGGGTLARELYEAGFQVQGYDLSPAMIEMARARVPAAEFAVASFVDVDLPECRAVTAIGEVLNYLIDERNDLSVVEAVLSRIFASLIPGGYLLFDVASLKRASDLPVQRFVTDNDRAVLVMTERAGDVLTRHITAFRRVGDLFRRSEETHSLKLMEPDEVCRILSTIGFKVEQLDSYGSQTLPTGLHAFLARKPE